MFPVVSSKVTTLNHAHVRQCGIETPIKANKTIETDVLRRMHIEDLHSKQITDLIIILAVLIIDSVRNLAYYCIL